MSYLLSLQYYAYNTGGELCPEAVRRKNLAAGVKTVLRRFCRNRDLKLSAETVYEYIKKEYDSGKMKIEIVR